jgi:hypothetical protein
MLYAIVLREPVSQRHTITDAKEPVRGSHITGPHHLGRSSGLLPVPCADYSLKSSWFKYSGRARGAAPLLWHAVPVDGAARQVLVLHDALGPGPLEEADAGRPGGEGTELGVRGVEGHGGAGEGG